MFGQVERMKLIREGNLIRLYDLLNGGEEENVKFEYLEVYVSLCNNSFLREKKLNSRYN